MKRWTKLSLGLVMSLCKFSSISDEILGFEISSSTLRTSTTVALVLSKLRPSLLWRDGLKFTGFWFNRKLLINLLLIESKIEFIMDQN